MGLLVLGLYSTLRIEHSAQLMISLVLLSALVVIQFSSRFIQSESYKSLFRFALILICTILTLRYIVWRATETMPTQYGLIAMLCGLFLFLAEVYGVINTLFGFFINIQPLHRKPIPLNLSDSDLPHVDIYIPTYNEDASIIRPTVIAATQINYPKEKLHVFILDDGGTAQKCNDPDASKANSAKSRALELKGIGERFGAGYLTREKNLHAKAGNLNNALQHTSGSLILILDCDHIPTEDFLQNTVGFFLADPKLFVVQTPHNFISPDPLEKNLNTYQTSPAENELFYDIMQPGLDFWGTSFFCGSAALLRRSVLDELGGIAGQTITEDAETTIDAMGLGYTTAYLNRPMVSGLQPETYSGFVIQRVRWGQGMLQIFLLKNPWLQPRMGFVQRMLYTNFAFYWGFALSRLIMLMAPPAFLIFYVNLCDATALELISYAVPSLLASLISTQYFYGRVRWPFISQLYEIIQSVYVTQGLWQVLRRPRSPSFKVTPKGEVLSNNFVSALTWPFYILLSFNLLAIIFGLYRLQHESLSGGAIVFVLFWASLDCILLLGALGVTYERKQVRSEPRVPHQEPIKLKFSHGRVVEGNTTNASTSGTGIYIPSDVRVPIQVPKNEELEIYFTNRDLSIKCFPRTIRRFSDHSLEVGLAYKIESAENERLAIAVAFGSSDNLIKNNSNRHSGRAIVTGLFYLIRFAFNQGLSHFAFSINKYFTERFSTFRF